MRALPVCFPAMAIGKCAGGMTAFECEDAVPKDAWRALCRSSTLSCGCFKASHFAPTGWTRRASQIPASPGHRLATKACVVLLTPGIRSQFRKDFAIMFYGANT
jgi:hypothetical protein